MNLLNSSVSKRWKSVVLGMTCLLVALFLLAMTMSSGDPRTGGADFFASIRKPILRIGNGVGLFGSSTNFRGVPMVPVGGDSASMQGGDGAADFALERFREPVFRPFWRRVGERVRIVLHGNLITQIRGMRLVTKYGAVVDEFIPTPSTEEATVEGYVSDDGRGYEIHLLYVDTNEWGLSWAWGWKPSDR